MHKSRSFLYVPADNQRALEKVNSLKADGYIFDLEDAIASDHKNKARLQLCEFMRACTLPSNKIIIRLNGLNSQWVMDDLKALQGLNFKALLLPKTESSEDILNLENKIKQIGFSVNPEIWAMIETPLGVLHAEEIGKSSKALTCLVMGTSDLAKDLKAKHTADRHAFLYAFSKSIAVARAYGLSILDGVHLDIDDEDGFKEACRQAKNLGFDGKTLIHPRTISLCHDIFTPTKEDIDWAKLVIHSFEEEKAKGKGVVKLYGKLIEDLHYQEAKDLLACWEES